MRQNRQLPILERAVAVIFQCEDQAGAMMNDVATGLVATGLVGAGFVGAGFVGAGFVGAQFIARLGMQPDPSPDESGSHRKPARPIAR